MCVGHQLSHIEDCMHVKDRQAYYKTSAKTQSKWDLVFVAPHFTWRRSERVQASRRNANTHTFFFPKRRRNPSGHSLGNRKNTENFRHTQPTRAEEMRWPTKWKTDRRHSQKHTRSLSISTSSVVESSVVTLVFCCLFEAKNINPTLDTLYFCFSFIERAKRRRCFVVVFVCAESRLSPNLGGTHEGVTESLLNRITISTHKST